MSIDEKLDQIQNLLVDDILTKLKRSTLGAGDIKSLTEAYATLRQVNVLNRIGPELLGE